MLFQRINRSDPEKIFIIVKNSYSTASLTNGQFVRWDHDTDCDGVGVTVGTEDQGYSAAGVVCETIAADAYGLIQTYGYHNAARVRTMTTTGHTFNESLLAVAKGTPLAYDITADVFCAEGVGGAASAQAYAAPIPCAFALAAQALWTTAAIAVFIKAM
jgi:hypothetical protein